MEQVTIRDIARKCKVGVSTVSRAMNNHPDINPETKEMILKVIAESNYVPNNSARNLKRSNAKAIAILVKGMDNMFFNNMISVIEEVVRKKKYACIIERVEEKANEVDSAIEIVKEKRLRGIIFLGGNFTHPHEKMAQIPVPYVISTIGAVSDGGKPCASVSVDDYRESYKMVDYLCGLGHRRIAIITACEDDIKVRSQKDSESLAATNADAAAELAEEQATALTGAAKSLCIPFDQPELPAGAKCFACGKPAACWCLFGRSY